MKVSAHVLDEMNAQRMNSKEAKIFISEKILIMSLQIIEVIQRKTHFKYPIDIFKKFNKIQKSLIIYLKMKYPRGGQTFIPGDLSKLFQPFDLVESP